MATVISQTDPRLVAIKAEILHGFPELTGRQINLAAFLAVVAINRLHDEADEDQKVKSESCEMQSHTHTAMTGSQEPLTPWQSLIEHEEQWR
jgi:hypothetical protein